MTIRWMYYKDIKPPISGKYYWKGKSGYGGYSFYDVDTDEWEFPDNVPVNKVDEEFLQWLNEYTD